MQAANGYTTSVDKSEGSEGYGGGHDFEGKTEDVSSKYGLEPRQSTSNEVNNRLIKLWTAYNFCKYDDP